MRKCIVVLVAGLVVLSLTGLAGVSSSADVSAKNKLNSKAEPDPDSGLKGKAGSPQEKAKSADAPKAKSAEPKGGAVKMKNQKAHGDPHVDNKTR